MSFLLFLLLNFSVPSLENTFLKGDLKNLEKYFSEEKKVYVELSAPISIYGFFSKSQILAIFGNVFRSFQTEKFKIKEKMESEELIILKVEWKIRDKIKKNPRETSVFMRFDNYKGRWSISEIKGTL